MNENYLSEAEKEAVLAFNANKTMVDAVKKVLLATVYHQGTVTPGEMPTDKNFAFGIINGVQKTDEQIGQELRASIQALNFIKGGFERLEEIKTTPVSKKKGGNPAV